MTTTKSCSEAASEESLVRNPGQPLDLGWVSGVQVNHSAIERRVASLSSRRALTKEWEIAWLLRAITCIDLTTLSGDDTPGNVQHLCAQARQPLPADILAALGCPELTTGAVCVYHNLIPYAVQALEGSGIPVAAVSTGFPAGQTPFELKLEEIRASVRAGAREIDIVISRMHVLTGNWQALYDEVKAFREACGNAHLKTILETYELATLSNVYKASLVCMMAGADFIKTSTGKVSVNATLPVGLTMARAIREYYERTGYKVGFKPAGGVRTAKSALDWLVLMKEELGTEWTHNTLFRIGASGLLSDIEQQVTRFVLQNGSQDGIMKKVMEIFTSMEYGPVLETSAQARKWAQHDQQPFQLFIANQWVAPASEPYYQSILTAIGAELAPVALAERGAIEQAVAAAQEAFETWSKTAGHVRARYLYALARHVQKHASILAQLETLNCDNVVCEARSDLPQIARVFSSYAGWAQLSESEFAGYEPFGVVAICASTERSLLQLALQIAPALAMGNTIVLKPAQDAPFSALKLAEIVHEIGLPAGVFNVITGDDMPHILARHPAVSALNFSGTTTAGREVREVCAGQGKRLLLNLDVRAPLIAFEDADLDSVVEGVVDAVWSGQGGIVANATRLFVQENIAPSLLAKLRTRIDHLRAGKPLDRTNDISVLLFNEQTQELRHLVELGKKEGLQYWQPAWASDNGEHEQPSVFTPTIFFNVAPTSQLAQAEVSGPVLLVTTFRTPGEAVQFANSACYGQAASVWSQNIDVVLDVATRLRASTVWVNSVNLQDAAVARSGQRESGFGALGGKESLYEYVRPAWLTAAPVQSTLPKRSSDFASGEVAKGSHKDIGSAVGAARKASGWSGTTAQNRAKVLYDVAEKLAIRQNDFARRIVEQTGCDYADAGHEVQVSLSRLFSYAAWSDKFVGAVQRPPMRSLVVETREALGVLGIAAPDEYPLLGLISLLAPAIAMGNTVVAIPSSQAPLCATDLYQVLMNSDVPAGVINIVTGDREALSQALAEHQDVDALWYFGPHHNAKTIELAALGNMKPIWYGKGHARNWLDRTQGEGHEFLHAATRLKSVWLPYGV
jgi:aldehyde dehydrogenase (NAD+)